MLSIDLFLVSFIIERYEFIGELLYLFIYSLHYYLFIKYLELVRSSNATESIP